MKSTRKLFGWIMIMFWASEYCHAPYFSLYLKGLGFASTAIGFVTGTYGFTQMLLRIPLGVYTDRKNAYLKVVLMGCAFTTISSFGLIFAKTVWFAALCRILAGAAASTWLAFTVLFSAYYKAEEDVEAMIGAAAYNNAGKFLAFVLGTIAASLWGYTVPLIISFAAGVAAVILTLRLKEIPMEAGTGRTIRDSLRVMKDPDVLIPAGFAAMQQFILHGTVFSFTSIVAAQKGASSAQIGIATALVTVVQIIFAKPVGGKIVPKIGDSRAVTVGFLLLTAYPLMVIFAPSVTVILIAQVICGFGCMLTYAVLSAKAIRYIEPELKSTAMGTFQALYGIGMTLGPLLIGGLAVNDDYKVPYVTAACLAAMTCLTTAVVLPARDRVKNMRS